MLRQISLTVVLVALLTPPGALGQSARPAIFLINASLCPGVQSSRSLTGFRAAGTAGVITALHGVAGCQHIRLQADQGPILAEPVLVTQMEINSDIAVLDSSELENKFPATFSVSQSNLRPDQQLQALGYPENLLKVLRTTVQVRNPAVVPLANLLSKDLLGQLNDRNSPSTLLNVISIQGNLLPGHSGGPIFDLNNAVVAIADGGLKEGMVAISWAIPIASLKTLQPYSGARLTSLLQNDPAVLFSFEAGSNEPDPSIELIRASEANDAPTLQRILSVNVPQDVKDTALGRASNLGNAEAMLVLISHGANPAGLLCYAVEQKNTRSAEVLARARSVNPNEFCDSDYSRDTPLNIAFRDMEYHHENTTDLIRLLLSIPGIDPNLPSRMGERPLFAAIDIGDEDLVRMLLNTKGIDVNLTNHADQTAAGQACAGQHTAILKLLLASGAKDNIYNGKEMKRCADTGHTEKR